MIISGEYRIAAPHPKVWDAVNNAEILRQCIPGCEEIVQTTPTEWTARVVARVGPVRARFSGQLSLQDIREPEHCKIVGSGSGGAAGFASGSADIDLVEQDGVTVLRYTAETEIGGKLAQIGSRLIDSFVKKYADDFFARFSALVEEDSVLAGARPAAADAVTGAGAKAVADRAATADAPSGSPVDAPVTPAAFSPPASAPASWFDAQNFTIVVLASLLVFMTIMLTMKS